MSGYTCPQCGGATGPLANSGVISKWCDCPLHEAEGIAPPEIGSGEWLDALHPILEEAAKGYFAKWPALDHGQHLAFQDAVLSALQKARRQGASNNGDEPLP